MAFKTLSNAQGAANELTSLGNITTGDELIVERVAGQTRSATFRVELSEDTTPQLGGNLSFNGFNVEGINATTFGYLSGVTSNIQTQLNAKAPTASPTFTGTVTIPTPFTLGAVSVTATGTEMNYLAGVTSNIQTQLNAAVLLPGSTSITTLGTITTGTWHATAVGQTYGGTGFTSYAAGCIIYADASSNLQQLGIGGNGTVLMANTGLTQPQWSQITLSNTNTVTGTLAVGNGGTGQTSYTNGQLLIGNTTGNTLTKATLSATNLVSITNGAGSITIDVAPAAQSDQETATSTTLAVTPGRQHFHPSAAKAWVKCGVTGNILASRNVSSITDTGTGDMVVNFTTSFSSANYCAVGNCEGNGSTAQIIYVKNGTMAAGSCEFLSVNPSVVLTDPGSWSAAFFGDI